MSQGNNIGFVRVMRSHDYNQFEVCLPFNADLGHVNPEWVDMLRKDAARLVDKAVRQYDQSVRSKRLAEKLSGSPILLDAEYEATMKVPVESWTPEQKASVALVRQKEWLAIRGGREYDYEDDAPEFDDQDYAF